MSEFKNGDDAPDVKHVTDILDAEKSESISLDTEWTEEDESRIRMKMASLKSILTRPDCLIPFQRQLMITFKIRIGELSLLFGYYICCALLIGNYIHQHSQQVMIVC